MCIKFTKITRIHRNSILEFYKDSISKEKDVEKNRQYVKDSYHSSY